MSFFSANPVKQFGLPIIAASVVVCGVSVAAPAQALEVVNRYSVTSAFKDSYGQYGGGHTVAGLLGKTHVTTSSNDLLWEEYDDGTARFFGTVYQKNQVSNGWEVNVFLKKLPGAGTGGPKKELKSNAYASNGGPIDPSTWDFYDFSDAIESTLIGFGSNDGRTLTIDDLTGGKFPVQVGFGANGKNANFGMSTWFKAYENGNQVDNHADFNVDFTDVPTPAAGLVWLFTGSAAIARKRKQSNND